MLAPALGGGLGARPRAVAGPGLGAVVPAAPGAAGFPSKKNYTDEKNRPRFSKRIRPQAATLGRATT